MLLGCLSIHAADGELITKQITLTLDKVGTLPDKISESQKNLITNLKIVGEVNGTDLKFIREMAGRGVYGGKTDGKLSILDLSEAKIVEGGDAYFLYWGSYNINGYYTSNDKLGDGAFSGCSGLTSLTIPSGVTSIGKSAFDGCSGLTSLTIPSSVTEIGNYAFDGCSGLTSLTLPSGITSISDYAFEYCSGLTSLTIPSGVTSIGYRAFSGCSGLTSLTIPSSVTEIGESAFQGCSGLTSLTIPSGVTSIGWGAFSGCSGLTSLTIPSSVTSIGGGAFKGCSGLTSLTIPSSVTSIGEQTFEGCSGLTSIYVYPENLPELGTDIFTGCDAKNCTVYVPKGTYDAYKSSEFGYFENIVDGINKDGLLTTQVTIKLDEAGTLPYKISANEKNLITNLKIVGKINGTDLKFIREMAGRDYYGKKTDGKLSILDLSEAKIVEGGSAYISYNGFCQYTYNDRLGYYAFYGCSGLTSLTIPSGFTSINNYTFYGCSGLTSLTIPSGVTSIGNYAFEGCSGLTSLTIPSGVTSIGNYAFNGCSGLTSIYVYPENLPELGTDIFTGCDAKNCTVYVPKGTYDAYKSSEFGYFENIVDGINKDGLLTTQVTIKLDEAGTLPYKISANEKNLITNLKIVGKINGTDLKFIREMAGRDFYMKKTDGKLSILDLSDAKIVEGGFAYIWYYGNNMYTSNDKLGNYVFYDCSGLTSLTLPSSVTSIGWYAFYGCSGLTSLTLPSSVTSIGWYAFYGCSGLTSLTLPSGVTSIGYEAFRGCSGLTSLTIPSSVTEIGDYAFKGCSGLTSLTLPSSVTLICWGAFEGCSGLTSIYAYLEKIPKLGSDVFTGCDAKNCTVYVPKGTYDAYKSSEFGYFEKIVEFDATGIDKVTTSTNAKEVSRYSANGQRLSAPAKGLNIVKYSDGSVKKVAIQ